MKPSNPYPTRHAFSFLRTVLAGVSCGSLALAALTTATDAIAAPEGKLKSMSLDLVVPFQGPSALPSSGAGGLTVISEDGVKWNRFLDAPVALDGILHIEMRTGRIKNFGIYWGECRGEERLEVEETPANPMGTAHGRSISMTR
jgi:hypothetical protein